MDATESPGMPSLILRAASAGHIPMVKALVKHADISGNFHAEGSEEVMMTPLSVAMDKGFLDVAQVLIENGAEVSLYTHPPTYVEYL